MGSRRREQLSTEQLDAIAWQFFRSEFATERANWPIERRIDAFLLRDATIGSVNHDVGYNALLECIMSNIGAAIRAGVLRSPNRL